jgi:NTP pyrophosphatase (non-canonical NTP hydrolase)
MNIQKLKEEWSEENTDKTSEDSIHRLICLIGKWHHDRNLIDGSDDKTQCLKLGSEFGELCDNIAKGRDIRDDLGDMMVVMINIMNRNEITMLECLHKAYNDIKDRKGRMMNGTFVKEEDL